MSLGTEEWIMQQSLINEVKDRDTQFGIANKILIVH